MLEPRKTYLVKHKYRGNFTLIATDCTDGWTAGVIMDGQELSEGDYYKPYETGDCVCVSNSDCTFEEQ